jgi:hypothetical protein
MIRGRRQRRVREGGDSEEQVSDITNSSGYSYGCAEVAIWKVSGCMRRGAYWSVLDYWTIGHECKWTSQKRGWRARCREKEGGEGWRAAALIGPAADSRRKCRSFSLSKPSSPSSLTLSPSPCSAREKPKAVRSFVRPCLVALPSTRALQHSSTGLSLLHLSSFLQRSIVLCQTLF